MPVTPDEPLDDDVGIALAARVVGRVVHVVDHVGDDGLDRRLRERPRLGEDSAPLRHDVRPARPPGDRPDVGGRLVVDPPESHRRDRLRGGEDRAPPGLWADPRVRGLAVQRRLEPVVRGRPGDDLPDRRGVIEDEAELGAQAPHVEGLGARQRVLLADREEQLDADRRALDHGAPRQRHEHRDGGLVVGTQDRVARALPAAVHQHGLDRAVVRDGVEVRAQEDDALASGGAGRDTREQVPALGAGGLRGVVLLDVEAQLPKLARHALGHRALPPEGRRDRAQLRERLVQPPALDLGGAPHLTVSVRATRTSPSG